LESLISGTYTLDLADVHGVCAFGTAFFNELYLVVFLDCTGVEARNVNEDFTLGFIVDNKAETLGGVEEFYYSCFHFGIFRLVTVFLILL